MKKILYLIFELADLYYNGKLKGDNLAECYKRISEYEIQS